MDLMDLYQKVERIIQSVDFDALWSGFEPMKFALYNERDCYFDNRYIEKTDQFLANTAILFQGEYIAIWNVSEDLDLNILCSKLIHEMFHAFQMLHQESRFPDELEALSDYRYNSEMLSLKMEENRIIAELVRSFDISLFTKLLGLRKYRFQKFPYEFNYEAKIEQIEGAANFVELNVLKQLSAEVYSKKKNDMVDRILNPARMIPVRIASYDIGALILTILKSNGISTDESFSDIPFSITILDKVETVQLTPDPTSMEKIVESYFENVRAKINDALKQNDCIVDGEYPLLGVNIYNAVYYRGYIISTYFMMYSMDGEQKILFGDYVIEMKDEKTLKKIFRV